MAFPVDWQNKVSITIDATKIDADLTDWTLILDQSFSSKLTQVDGPLDADGIRNMINGGGDIRFSSDAAGLTRLAVDVRNAVTDNTPANGTLELAIKIASVSSSVDTVIYFWWGKAAATQPSVSDTYGQYNAYDDDYVLVLPLSEDPSDSAPQFKDRTTGQNHGTKTSGTLNSVSGKVGNAIDFDDVAADSYLSVPSFSDVESMTALSVEVLAKTIGTGDAFSEIVRKGLAGSWFLLSNSTNNYRFSKNGDNSEYTGGGSPATIGTWFHLCGTGTSGVTTLYTDGVSTQNVNFSGIGTNTDDIDIGNYQGGAQQFEGTLDEVRISKVTRSAAWAKANYNNQTDQTGFLTWGSIVDIDTGSFAGTLPIITMSASGSASSGSGATGTFAGSLPLFTMAASGDAVRNGPFAGSLPIITMSAAGTRVETGTFASDLPIPTMSASGSASAGVTGTLAGTLPIFTMASSGDAVRNGPFAGSLPSFTMSASGTRVETGTFAGTLPIPTMSASGSSGSGPTGTFSASLPIPTMSASGDAIRNGPFAGSLPIFTMSASGNKAETGTFAGTLPAPTMSSSGSLVDTGTFAADLPIPTMSAAGLSGVVNGSMAATMPIITMSASGSIATQPTPTSEGLQWDLPSGQNHWTMPKNKLDYTIR